MASLIVARVRELEFSPSKLTEDSMFAIIMKKARTAELKPVGSLTEKQRWVLGGWGVGDGAQISICTLLNDYIYNYNINELKCSCKDI